ncbi:MAG: LysR family transcriptional regulator [Burkholderiales bacterium]|nr:LysR family transcriptional regulator [Burkholderiales bacterium]
MDADDPALPNLKMLRLFELLYATASVTRAAEQLGQSQPTVSIWLAQLRRLLGDPLFVRTPAGMQPTPRAQALMPTVRETLAGVRRLVESAPDFAPAQSTRRFRICMTDASHITLLPRLLARLRGTAPGVRLEATRIDADTAHALESGDADLALGLVPGLESGFYQQRLYTQDWVCLVNRAHPRLADGRLTRRRYEAEPHVGIVAGTGHQLLAETIKAHAVQRRVHLELPSFLGLPAILSTTDLVATLPRQIGETLAQAAGLRVLKCPLPIPSFEVRQHWHARVHHDAANRWLRGVCAELFMSPEAAARAAAST